MRGLIVAALLAVSVFVGVEQFAPADAGFASVFADTVQVVAPAKVSYARGITTLQGQPCDDSRGGVDYRSEIISRDEMKHEIESVGFTGERVEQMLAVSLAEGGRQVSCVADENLVDAKWGPSIGVFSIRTLNAELGSGSCRDRNRIDGDLHQQAVCAFEISGQGRTLQPWSTFTNGRWRKYVGQ